MNAFFIIVSRQILFPGIPVCRGYLVAPLSTNRSISAIRKSGVYRHPLYQNGQLRHFTDRPFIELQDAMPPLRELWGAAANRLNEQLWAAPNQQEQILLIERFLLAQLNYHHQATAQKLDRLMEQIYYTRITG